ncbi:MAG TPA: hypothetical protein DE061_01520 [Clostridiales bacterium]|nr:hypothetical protein [Clostridiales bacterium]
MLFFLNLDGTVTRSDTDHVYQGQNKVANVELFTQISPAQTALQVAFTLPNGLTTTYAPMSYVGAYSVDESNQKQVHRWKLAVPYNVTEYEGQVGVSFNVLLNDGTSGVNQTTYTSSFTVEYSALPIPPTTATEDELGQLLDLLNLYYAQNATLIGEKFFQIGTVETKTLAAGANAKVEVVQSPTPDEKGNYPTNFKFEIPQGADGVVGVDVVGGGNAVTGAAYSARDKSLVFTKATEFATASQVDKKYTKPSGGIPESDLADDVKKSLGKADSALQSAPVTSVNGQTGAVQLGASDVGALPSSTKFVSSVNGQTGAVTNIATKDEVNAKQNALTETQLAAVNSGITSSKVTQYDGYDATIKGKANASDLPIKSASLSGTTLYLTL